MKVRKSVKTACIDPGEECCDYQYGGIDCEREMKEVSEFKRRRDGGERNWSDLESVKVR